MPGATLRSSAAESKIRYVASGFRHTSVALPISEDPIHCDTLVKTMDAVMGAGFPAVSLLDAAPG